MASSSVVRAARRFTRKGRELTPLAELAVGFLLFAVPIPEPTTEAVTDVAGVAMMGDAVRRMRTPSRRRRGSS